MFDTKTLIFLIVLPYSFTSAAQTCAAAAKGQVPAESSWASAGSLTNALGRERSVKNQARKVLSATFEKISTVRPLPDMCKPPCSVQDVPTVVFRCIPTKNLEEYENQAYCRDRERETTVNPITYPERSFEDLNDVISWFGDISQGDGEEGEDLYEKCDRDCSPRYTVTIRKTKEEFLATASIVCGEARDKDEGTYQMKTAFEYRCEMKS